tara:strand:- start:5785 stop:6690 length:906 start_codon:yes stop_codon:yes gene_type:complete
MNYSLLIFIFIVVLFLYLHIFHHLKISEDLEVYSIVNPTKTNLEEICGLKQPVIFTLETPIMSELNIEYLNTKYNGFQINLQNYEREKDNTIKYNDKVPFKFDEALNILKMEYENDKGFISDNNSSFLDETTIKNKIKNSDMFLRPPMVSLCNYDLLLGSKNSITKLRYNLNYRNYIMCLDNSVTIRVINPNYERYMDKEQNYLDFEFSSPINVWDIQDKYKKDFEKVQTSDIVMNKGDVVYIPTYWYYSIKFDNISSLLCLNYRTYMNTLAITPELIMYFLQNQNIKLNSKNVYKDKNTI